MIYFGEVSAQEADEYGGEFFEFNGKLYDYCVSYNADNQDLRIEDSVGRVIPIGLADCAAFFKAMKMLQPYLTSIAAGEQAVEALLLLGDECV